MDRPFNKDDDECLFFCPSTGQFGALEAPPLQDPGEAEAGQGILWVSQGSPAGDWFYVGPEEVHPVTTKNHRGVERLINVKELVTIYTAMGV